MSIDSRVVLTTAAVIGSAWLLVSAGCREAGQVQNESRPPITGDWLGQAPPGESAELFAPGIVSTGMFTRDLAVGPNGDEIYFTIMLPHFEFSSILVTKRENGVWSEPAVAPFSGRYRDLEPAIAPDGGRLFFVSYRPDDAEGPPEAETDIWVVEREQNGWGPPRPIGSPINSEGDEYFPSVTRSGTLYFTRRLPDGDEAIYRAEADDGSYSEPGRLGPEVNAGRARYNAYVSADERFLIVPIFGLEDSLGGTDYYVSFRNEDGSWQGPVHLGEPVNSDSRLEYAASLSPDGRYLFFMSARADLDGERMDPPLTLRDMRRFHEEPENGNPGIYWIDAGFIDGLKPDP